VFNDRVPAAQQLLFPDPQPLVERLGRDFFRQLPATPGVYLMRDARDAILYVGKAKNLRKRLGAYRVANPDRMPRRHLRLVRAVARIELQECADELSALAREAELGPLRRDSSPGGALRNSFTLLSLKHQTPTGGCMALLAHARLCSVPRWRGSFGSRFIRGLASSGYRLGGFTEHRTRLFTADRC